MLWPVAATASHDASNDKQASNNLSVKLLLLPLSLPAARS
jgi:hypothetical protein